MVNRLMLMDQLHHVCGGRMGRGPMEVELLVRADRFVGGDDAVLVIDDTALPKKGCHSCDFGPKYASSRSKTANCQPLGSVNLARVTGHSWSSAIFAGDLKGRSRVHGAGPSAD